MCGTSNSLASQQFFLQMWAYQFIMLPLKLSHPRTLVLAFLLLLRQRNTSPWPSLLERLSTQRVDWTQVEPSVLIPLLDHNGNLGDHPHFTKSNGIQVIWIQHLYLKSKYFRVYETSYLYIVRSSLSKQCENSNSHFLSNNLPF